MQKRPETIMSVRIHSQDSRRIWTGAACQERSTLGYNLQGLSLAYRSNKRPSEIMIARGSMIAATAVRYTCRYPFESDDDTQLPSPQVHVLDRG